MKKIFDDYHHFYYRMRRKMKKAFSTVWGGILVVLFAIAIVFGLITLLVFLGALALVTLIAFFLAFPIISSPSYQARQAEIALEIELCVIATLRSAKMRKNYSDGWMTVGEVDKSVRKKLERKRSMWHECNKILEELKEKGIIEKSYVSREKIQSARVKSLRSQLAYRITDTNYNPRSGHKKKKEKEVVEALPETC